MTQKRLKAENSWIWLAKTLNLFTEPFQSTHRGHIGLGNCCRLLSLVTTAFQPSLTETEFIQIWTSEAISELLFRQSTVVVIGQ